MSAAADLGELLTPLLASHLPRQRWYSGPEALEAGQARIASTRRLWAGADGASALHQVLVDVDGSRFQLLVGERPLGEVAEPLGGHDEAIIGTADGRSFFDATLDPELACELLGIVTGGGESASVVRPVSAEQSNTSLVFDDRTILKVFRRLQPGRNPDVEVTSRLAAAGFAHVARPVASWRDGDVDLAFAQEYLAGGTEGWALAMTSLRDYYRSVRPHPGEAGGDFSMEASRLGRVTAEMHVHLAEAFGVGEPAGGEWLTLVEDVARRLHAWVDAVPAGEPSGGGPGGDDRADRAGALLERLRSVDAPGPVVRVHGDLHLGQVMRADSGWYVLDFEGEPARPLEERARPASPLKDVAGMLRSFDYAARVALAEQGEDPGGGDLDGQAAAEAWVEHNSTAFLDGYLAGAGIAALLPAAGQFADVLAAYELDKALYELDYERAYRPSWVPIPAGAIARIVGRSGG